MDQRLHVITIGADSLPVMVNFYVEKLGWKPIAGNTGIVFFKVSGFLISIVQRQLLANFTGIPLEKKTASSFTFGYNVNSREEVISQYEMLKKNNVRIVKEPVEPATGACFFYF